MLQMWFTRSQTKLTPEIAWRRSNLGPTTLYRSEDAPPETDTWLRSSARTLGPFVNSGLFGCVYRVANQGHVVKESFPPFKMTAERWDRYCGLNALALNVALQQGLRRIGDEAILSTGARVTTPTYHAQLLAPGMARLLMSFEAGERPDDTTRHLIGTTEERCAIYDKAVRAVGVDPATLESYDDKEENLLVRSVGPVTEVVMLDACNFPLPQSAAAQRLP